MDAGVYKRLVDGMPAEWMAVLEVASQMLVARMRDGAPCELFDLMRAYLSVTGGCVGCPAQRITPWREKTELGQYFPNSG